MARTATTTDVFSAIGDVNRRELLSAIGTGEATVGELVGRLGLSQPQVSKHLGVLRAVELVEVRPAGRQRYYSVNGPALKPLYDWVGEFEGAWRSRLDRLEDLVNELKAEQPAAQGSDAKPGTKPGSGADPQAQEEEA